MACSGRHAPDAHIAEPAAGRRQRGVRREQCFDQLVALLPTVLSLSLAATEGVSGNRDSVRYVLHQQ